MDDLSFLDQPSATDRYSNAILRVVLSNGQVSQVSDRINPYELLVPCPLLFHAFEDGYDSRVQANIEAPSTAAAVMLLRYCYTSSYLPSDFEFLPISFLPHAEIYKMAEDFDIPELQLLAYGNFTCQFEFASSLPEPPIDLPETIRFVYMHYSSNQARQQQDLIKTVLHFCVSAFVKLSRNNDFLEVFRQVPQFRQDLCLTNMERDFADDCAPHIIQFALRTMEPSPATRPTLLASRDLPQEMLIDQPEASTVSAPLNQPTASAVKDDTDSDITLLDLLDESIETSTPGQSTLAFRPKTQLSSAGSPVDSESSGEEEGFTLVHRPKDELMSSPEVVPTGPINVLALTGSNYPDEDEWTLI